VAEAANGSLWRNRDFLKLWGGETVSVFGSQISLLAIPLAAIAVLHASTLEVGLLSMLETLPFLLIGLPAGVWVDRTRRRPILITGDFARAALLGSIPLAYALGLLTITQLYVVAFVAGICTVFFDVAYMSFFPVLVSRRHLVDGNAKMEVSRSAAQVAGPGLAGVLVRALSAPGAVALDAASFAVSGFAINAIHTPEAPPKRENGSKVGRLAGLGSEMKEGLRFVLHQPQLRLIAGSTATFNLFSSLGGTILLLYMVRVLGFSAGKIGLVFLLGNIGFVVGALLASPSGNRLGVGPTLGLATAFGGASALLAPLASRTDPAFLFIVAAIFGTTLSVPIYNVNQVSLRQALCPDRLQGRMNATMRFIVWGTLPIGSLLAGVLGATLGLHEALWIGAIGQCLAAPWVLAGPVRRVKEIPSIEGAPAPTA
jgi:MFS family permease